jgi:hypothetical protein
MAALIFREPIDINVQGARLPNGSNEGGDCYGQR